MISNSKNIGGQNLFLKLFATNNGTSGEGKNTGYFLQKCFGSHANVSF